MSETILTPEALALIGSETEWGEPYTIERSTVERFLESIGDENPVYFDRNYAEGRWYHGFAVPPNFLLTNLKSGTERDWFTVNEKGEFRFPVNAGRRLRGGDEIEVLAPMCIGDTIRAKTKIVDITEKAGKSGNMAFIYSETQYRNQREEIVMVSRTTVIMR